MFAGALAALYVTAPTQSMAQVNYPSRAINFIVPLPAGGGPDLVTRIIAERLSTKWGQSVVVENRPGFVLNLGAQAVANALPDGYTLLSTPPGARHQRILSFQHRVRPASLCSGFDHGPITLRACGAPEGPCLEPLRADRLRQGESRQAQFPIAGHRQPAALVRRDAQDKG